MTFLNEMKTRIVEYNAKEDWTLKVSPQDIQLLESADETVYIEVWVSDVDETIQLSGDLKTGKIEHLFQVYRASERVAEQLSQIPNSHFYESRFSPSIGMTIKKQALQQIASNPSVYCIRVIPPLTPFLGMSEIRVMDDISYTMANHDTTLDASTHIVVIGSGYDPNDSYLGGDANDNIMPTSSWDFTDSNTDVSNGANVHESSVTDTMVNAFGDFGTTDYSMYENRNFWTPLKICDDSYNTANQYALQAIEWCVAHDVDVVCMSWGAEPALYFGMNTCNAWWCTRLQAGTLGGTTWVAGAGNKGHTNGVGYPAESHFCVAVGAYDFNPAQKLDMEPDIVSSYGETTFRYYYWPYGWVYACATCYNGVGAISEFKPNVYECGYLGYWGWGAGTSYSAPLACADIAIGMYSPGGGEYNQGYNYLLSVLDLCHEFPVSPSECSTRGDVIDTHTLWHRQAVTP